MNNKKKKFIVAAVILAGGTVLFSVLVLLPLVQGVRADAAKLVLQRQERMQVQALEQELLNYQQLKEDSAGAFLELEQLFVDPGTPISFIEFLEGISSDGGFVLKIVPGVAKQEKGAVWPSASFQLSSAAPYPNLLVFLEKLEASPYLLSVENASLSRATSSSEEFEGATTVQFTVLVKVFTKPLP